MDTVVNRIIEIERESALRIEQAHEASENKIEAHRRALAEKKEQAQAHIISDENTRLTEALRALNQQIEEASLAASRDYEGRFQNSAKIDAVKEKIVAILLVG